MGSNPMRWGLVAILVLAVVVVIANSGQKPVGNPPANNPPVGGANQSGGGSPTHDGDGDTVAESLRSVQAQYGEVLSELKNRDKKSDEQAAEIEVLKEQLALQGQNNPQAPSEDVSKLQADVESLQEQLAGQISDGFDKASSFLNGNYQVGLGLGDEGSHESGGGQPQPLPGYVSLRPLTVSDKPDVSNSLSLSSGDLDPASAIEQSSQGLSGLINSDPVRPFATIPARSTLLNAKSMTALIGRVPVGGKVLDPFPVKVIVGGNNLAANGHRVEGLQGMVFDGTATGDWTLSCVSVKLTGATFIFEDGSIRHAPSTSQSVQDGVTQGIGAGIGADEEATIGYLSDRFGTPCISGKRMTDAHKQAALFGILNMAQSGLDAKAAAETTVTRESGSTSSSLTGDKEAFSKYSQYAGLTEGIIDVYRERFQDTFDAIYAPNGIDVVANITRDLHIDYMPGSRRLNYNQEIPYAYNLD